MRKVATDDIDAEIGRLTAEGFRLAMIFPADSPRVAEMTLGAEKIRIELNGEPSRDGEWHTGRAGMEYRDLLPDRLGGRIIASHIRIPVGGPIPDYVHFHPIDFQLIYCLAGRARLVYEDQGYPFWFEAGDLVVQPPRIRHRVLECSDGFEVFEIASPAEHPTFADHETALPDGIRDRDYSGQRFVHRKRSEAGAHGTSVGEATGGVADLDVFAAPERSGFELAEAIAFVARGRAVGESGTMNAGDCRYITDPERFQLEPGTEVLAVRFRRD